MINYPLELGNNIERSLFPIMKAYFPIYEDYRSEFLMPLTGLPKDPNWRKDTHPELERIGVASYGILKSLNFVFIKKDKIKVSGDPEQTFKNVYFHFGLAADCVDAAFRSIVMIESELKMIDVDKKLRLNEPYLIDKFTTWVSEEYGKCYENMINDGKPIFYYPQHDNNYSNIIVTEKSIKKEYLGIVRKLKDYRNFFTHNPGVDVFMDTDTGKRYAIKKEMVSKSRNWSTLRDLYNIDQNLFIDPEEMITYDLIDYLNSINKIWPSVIKNMDSIYHHTSFPQIFKGYKRKMTIDS